MHTRKIFQVLCFIVVLFTWTANAQKVDVKITNYPIPSTGVVIYAAPEDATPYPGKTTNSGTSPSSPWTLTRAFLDAPANATVIVRGGEYRAVSQNRITNKITVQAYPGEEPWIKGSMVVSDWQKVEGANVWVHANWPYEFPKSTTAEDIGTNPLCDNRDMLYINDQSLKQVDSLKNVKAGTFYVDYAADKLYVGTNPGTGKVESTRFSSPLMRKNATGGEVRVPNGTTIKGLGFTHFADDGLEVVCAGGLRIEDNTFAWNGEAGAALVAPTAVIRGNVFAYNGKVGMAGNNLRETIVEYNHAYENNIEGYSLSWAAAGIKVIATKNLKMKHNLVENNYATGIWLDISAIDHELTYNRVRENSGFGIFSETSNGSLIAGNILVNNKNYAIALSDADSSEVWNNTIVSNTGRGFFIKDTPRESKNTSPGDTFYSYVFGNKEECSWITWANVIKNNLVVTNTGLWMENTQPSILQVKESDFNGYYRTSTAGVNIYKWNNVNYASLDAFKAAVPDYEKNSIALYNQSVHPFFSDTSYKLKANSPAVKAGSPLPEKIAKLLGWPANNEPVDMGAVQSEPPVAPSGLVTTVISQRTVSLSWTDNADNEEGYRVERSTAGGAFEITAILAANATSYKETNLQASTRYIYRVTGFSGGGASSSNQESVITPAAGTGLLATYYRNTYFIGGSATRIDATVDFNWGEGSPDVSVSQNTFSVRWEAQIEARYNETYTFKTVTDDGVKVWINGQLLIDDFRGYGRRTNTANIVLEADKKYAIKIEYFENSGTAMAQLYWSSQGQAEEIVPQSQLYPAAPSPTYGTIKEITEVKLNPNPASGQTTLRFDAKEGELFKVAVINMINVVVLTYNGTTQQGANNIVLDVSSLRPGVYAVILQRGNTILPKLLIVK